MAKREIPEINAGSMADIAFLLLIFFLVTTTMDKDQAFLRTIPKKIENPPETPPVEKRNIFAIKANNKNQLLVRGQIMENPDDISDKILEFYRENERENNPTNNFPMYTRTTMDVIEGNIARIDGEIEALEAQPSYSEDILQYKLDERAEWQAKKNALQFYGKPVLPEIHHEAHVRVEVQVKTEYSLLTKIHTEIQEAVYTLRNDAAKEIWGTSYDVITKKIDIDPKESVQEQKELDLLELLYNVRIIEVTPK